MPSCGTSGTRSSPLGGGRRRFGEGERDEGERFRGPEGPGEYEVPGGGVGRRTADCSISRSAILQEKRVNHFMR